MMPRRLPTTPWAPKRRRAAPEKRGWWTRLTSGMKRTSSALSDRVTGLFTKRKLDANTLEDLEDALIQADFGVETATRISEAVGKGRYEKGISPDEVRAILATEVERALEPVAKPLVIDPSRKPFVILMVGVNGAGKTTTLGKLSLSLQGRRPLGDAGGRRHLPRRRDRAAQGLGRAHRHAGGQRGARGRCRGPRLRRPQARRRPRAPTCC